MIENPIEFFGTTNPAELLHKFHQVGVDMLRSLRNIVTHPDSRKKPRTWGAVEAAELVGVSSPTFRKLLEKNPELDGIVFEESESGKIVKKFTLLSINLLRDQVKTRYIRPDGASCLTIAVSNLKGGVGKTITAVELAKKMAIEGLRVLLLDFDAQGTATLLSSGLIPDLEVSYESTITNTLLKDFSKINQTIIETHFDGLHIIPANLAIQDCDLLLTNDSANNKDILGSPFTRLLEALKYIKDRYDVILIDCSPNIGPLTLNAVISCDGLIIPIPPNMNNYSSFITYTETLGNLFSQIEDKKLSYLRILLSVHKGNNEALLVENMMRQQYGRYILTNTMCETVQVAKASNDLGTIYDISKPIGNRDAYRRAIEYQDNVNMEIINNFKTIWEYQSKNVQKVGQIKLEGVIENV